MSFSELTLKLLILLIPGVIAILVIDLFTNHSKKDLKYFLLHSYLLSIIAYFIHSLFSHNSFFVNILDSRINIDLSVVIHVSIIGFLLGVVLSYLINYKILYNLAAKFKLSKKFGDGEVWESIISNNDVSWVTIRDNKSRLTYLGKILHFSDVPGKRELALTEVDVFTEDSDYLYSQQLIYFDFVVGENLVIEIGNSYNINEEVENDA
ncbi:hypothetical protein BBH88_11365 [Planococcus antarcticus DSM 14505]|uniref:Uncharacterized protein n=1 Tax=Planococcus antarcticus DSM 14505 TaxID=1185653 RepID=A0ABM6D623_9BACL|nr:hypothetical protein [Planococcus antarcticus]ANU10867.1 hypothetical protein BBH88_11365 [Planococcus antarcticus DSM 14505]